MNWHEARIREADRLYQGWSLPARALWPLRRARHRAALADLRDRAGDLFFIHGTGRSGTQLVASLLDRARHGRVLHEPDFRTDLRVMPAIHADPDRALAYWQRFRAARVQARWRAAPEARMHGEVTGMIRHHAPALGHLFPDAKQYLLVRHPAGFVRSLIGWTQFYGPQSRGAYALAPLPGDAGFEPWDGYGRFEKCCWAWADTYRRLVRTIPQSRHLRLEDIAGDYGAYLERLDRPLGLGLGKADWDAIVAVRSQNATRQHRAAGFADWTRAERASFERICGPVLDAFGYDLAPPRFPP